MSPEARQKLAKINIVAPDPDEHIQCPQCQSHNTRLLSQFGSTACKAMYSCNDCAEVFDYFKAL
jgi:ring-1,2-phenylacetyl-CoA epoxidase subunit PaaD